AEREGLVGQPPGAGKTVHHPLNPAAAFLPKDGHRVVFGLPRVNDDGQVELAREANLEAEHGLLDVFRGEVVVVVETELAEGSGFGIGGDHAPDEGYDVSFVATEAAGLMGVDADA